jgi:hydrogenase expression/formation protein HypC
MCLAVPMKISAIDGFLCTCEARGIEREVSLFMMQGVPVEVGDNVLVHVGYAIQRVSAEEAAESWQLFDQMLAAEG